MSNMGSNPTVIITGPRQAGVRDEQIRDPGVGEVLVAHALLGHQRRHGAERLPRRGAAVATRQDRDSHLFVADAPEWTYPLVYGYATSASSPRPGRGCGSRWSASPSSATSRIAPGTCRRRRPDPAPAARRRAPGVFLANLTTALNGVLDAHPNPRRCVVVSGLGVIGLLVTRLLRRAGAGP